MPRRRPEKNGALAEPWKWSEHWNKKIVRRRRTAVYKESWWDVCAWIWMILIQCHIFIYLILAGKMKESWTMNIEIINLINFETVVLMHWLKLFLSSAKGREASGFKISIIYHQPKFVVYVQVYLYTPSGEQKIWKFKLKPPGSAIVTVRPFFKFQILFLAHFETSWPCTEKYILICKLFPIKKFRNVMKYNFEKRLYHIYSFALKLTFSSSL